MSKESIYIIIITLIIILGIILNWTNEKIGSETAVVCPTDLKLCPNGSYVGRTLPDCAFLECPKIEEPLNEENEDTVGATTSIISL